MAIHKMNKDLINHSKESCRKLEIDNLEPIIDEYVNAGELTIIESRPAMGKTSFMLNIVTQMLKQGKRVLFISLELCAYHVVERLLPLFENRNQLIESGLIIDDTACVDVDDLFNHEYIDNVDLIVIDYLGLLNLTNDNISTHRDFGYILNRLKQLSLEKQVPVIVAAQLSQRIKEYPRFMEADNTIRLYREPVFEENIDVNRIIESRACESDSNTEDRYYHHFGD